MPVEVILPKVDMDMATGKIARWHVAPGARVAKGDPLFEIETDKAAMEIEAPAAGVLDNIVASEGVDIPVGQAVAWIYAEGEARDMPDLHVAAPAPVAEMAAASPAAFEHCPGEAVRATPLARRLAAQRNIALADVPGTGPRGRVQAQDVEALRPEPAAAAPRAGSAYSTWLRQGDGEPIVLIHGFGAETASWRPLLTAFERPMPIVSIDLPGHGAAADVEAQAFEDLVDHVERELATLGIGAAHLVGHSLGGAVALALAAGVAIEARSLLLIAPAGLGPEIDTGFTQGFAAATDEATLRRWMGRLVADPGVLTDSFVRATQRARADGRLPAAQSRLAQRLFGDGAQRFSTRPALDHLAMPVKVIVGGADRVIPPRHAEGLPGAVGVHRFEGLGHMPQLEAREAVARLLDHHVR